MTQRDCQQVEALGVANTRSHATGLVGDQPGGVGGETTIPIAPAPSPYLANPGPVEANVPVANAPLARPGAAPRTSRRSGFTLAEIMTVAGIIGLVAGIAIPSFVRAREQAQLKSIISNLRVIEAAKDTYALENRKGTGTTTDLAAIKKYLKGGTVKLVINETYTTGKIGTAASAKAPVALGTYAAKKRISSP